MRRRIFDRVVLARLAVAVLLVVPPLVLFDRQTTNAERTARNEQAAQILARNQAELAKERVDRIVAACDAFNEQRSAFIATSETLIRLAATSSPLPLTDRDRLLLAAFVQRADRQVSAVTKPKTCTIPALGLQPLEGIARQAESLPAAKPAAPTVRSVTTVGRQPPVTVRACEKPHGRCRPKR